MEEIRIATNEVVVNIALGIISIIGLYATYCISRLVERAKVQITQMKAASERQTFLDALADVEKLATLTVAAYEQTTAKELREAVKNGSVSREQLDLLGRRAKQEVRTSVSPEARIAITKHLGSFDNYLTKLVEERVLEVKNRSCL